MKKEEATESFVDALMNEDLAKAKASPVEDAAELAELWDRLGKLQEASTIEAQDRFAASLRNFERDEFSQEANKPLPMQSGWAQAVVSWAGIAAVFAIGLLIGGRFLQIGGSTASKSEREYQQELNTLRTLALLQNASTSDRLRGVYDCAEMDPENVQITTALLRSARSDESANVRVASLQVLERYLDDAFVRDEMRQLLEESESPLVKVHVIRSLLSIEDSAMIPFLEKIAIDPSEHRLTREQAVEALRQLKGEPDTVRATAKLNRQLA